MSRSNIPSLNSLRNRRALAMALMKLFEHWQLNDEQSLKLLGLDQHHRPHLHDYRCGQKPIPVTDEMEKRASYLMSIHKQLRQVFPDDPDLKHAFMLSANEQFNQRTPVEVIMQHGLYGYKLVYRLLKERISGEVRNPLDSTAA